MTPDGTASGTPVTTGSDSWTIQVSDGNGGTDTATLNITVGEGNHVPSFSTDPVIEVNATEGVAYSSSIADNASDSDGDPLTFQCLSAAGWLTVASDGTLSGTPTSGDVGQNSWTVEVADGLGGVDTATLQIIVDALQLNSPVTVNVSEDATTKQANPTTKYGTTTDLELRQDGGSNFARVSYLKFNVSGLSDPVYSATLHLRSDTETDPVNAVAVSDTTWTETEIDWNTRPTTGSVIGSGQGSAGSWFAIDVTGYVTNNGTYSIALDEQGDSVADLFSRESGNVPYLEIVTYSASDNTAPAFTSDPINKADATEDSAYSGTIAGSATDDDGDDLTYSKTDGPSWLTVASDGFLSGTPSNGDVGSTPFTVQVSDGNGGTDTATLNITVNNVNDAPVFTADLIVKADATEATVYSATIAGSATDVDTGDTLTYALETKPQGWLYVASDGTLSGTPATGDIGTNTFEVSVNDGNGGTDTATLQVVVVEINDPPVWNSDPFTQVSATEDTPYSSYLNWRVTDDEGDSLTFSIVSGPSWATITNSSNGRLVGTPLQGDVGTGTFTVSVSDGVNPAVEATMYLEVLNTNDVPVFTADPFSASNAMVNEAYSNSLAGAASDEDGDTLSYALTSAQDWLYVASDGTLSGTPATAGTNTFTIEVSDGNGGTDSATLEIIVSPEITSMTVDVAEDAFIDNKSGAGDNGTVLTVLDHATKAWDKISYLKFTVSGMPKTPVSATLYVYSINEADLVNLLSVADNNWSEGTIDTASAPAAGSTLDTASAAAGSWIAFDVTSTITADGTYSFAMQETGNTEGTFSAKEAGSNIAYLDIQFGSNQTPYEEWASGESLSGNDAEQTADPDSDDANNLIEYALGGDPGVVDGGTQFSGMLKPIVTGSGIEFVYPKRKDAATRGLIYTVETCENISDGIWSNASVSVTGTGSLDADFESVTNSISTDGAVKLFFRLFIEQQ
jgi:hypothetical protein